MGAVTVSEGTPFKGRKITVYWKGERIPGVREKSIQMQGEVVDVTSDDDDGLRRLATENGFGQKHTDVNVNGVTKSSQLREDWQTNEISGELRVIYPTGHELSGTAVLVNYNETGPYKDAVTFEAQFQYSGTLTYDYTPS